MSWIKESEQDGKTQKEEELQRKKDLEYKLDKLMDSAQGLIDSVFASLREGGYSVTENPRIPDSYTPLPFSFNIPKTLGVPALMDSTNRYAYSRLFEIADRDYDIGSIHLIPVKDGDSIRCVLIAGFLLYDRKEKKIIESDQPNKELPVDSDQLILMLKEWIAKRHSK
ncbi:MAG: hypothetical protein ABI758_00485 [Candidatus Woesebacteria bacterium]